MEKIIALSLTLVAIASASLILNLWDDKSVSAASIPAPPILIQQPEQQAPDDQTSESPPPGMELLPSQGEPSQGQAPNPNQAPTQQTQPPEIATYRIIVKFVEITVHNDHDPLPLNDGEFILNAYVGGVKKDLTQESKWRDDGLYDVESGETVKFSPANMIGVDLESPTPLTIFTVGFEDDGCKLGGGFPLSVKSLIDRVVDNQTKRNASAAAGAAIGGVYGGPVGAAVGKEIGPVLEDYSNKLQNWLEGKITCAVNQDDDIGKINEVYDSPSYGAGPHTVKSDAGDWTLKYTVSKPVQITAQKVK